MNKYLMQRGWMDMPIFADEPFTEREAFSWMIETAVWQDERKRCGNVIVSLKRGQLAYSERFLAKKWGWHSSKVHRFLNRLKIEALIETDSKQLINVITICQYNELQDFDGEYKPQTEAASEAVPKQERSRSEANKNTLNTLNTSITPEVDGGVAQSAPQPPPSTAPEEKIYLGEANEGKISKRSALPISSEFNPADEWGDYAGKLGFSQQEILSELEKFVAYYTVGRGAGKRRTTRGWRQSWSNWLEISNNRRR